jgi:molybdenum cofactor synthesis domain-containing protein
MYRIAIITASDKGSAGEREDISGKVIAEMFLGAAEVCSYSVLPDERMLISAELRRLCDDDPVDVILTTGGTGFSPRDVTPEATLDVVERLAPGLPEAMRANSLKLTDRAMLSRAAAGIRGKTLIVNLPGSPKAVRECLEVIMPALGHAVEILTGSAGECAR